MESWIASIVETTGVLGIAFLMLLENVIPPIPSELIMPLAGYLAAQGKTNLPLVILAGAAGSLLGGYVWYAAGRYVGEEGLKRLADRYGRWLTMTRADVDKADDWFDRHGWKAVLLGRLVPTVRTLISIPAGLSEMPVGRFLLYSSIGTSIWTSLLALLGYALGSQYERVNAWIDPVSLGIAVLIGAIYLWRVATFRRPA